MNKYITLMLLTCLMGNSLIAFEWPWNRKKPDTTQQQQKSSWDYGVIPVSITNKFGYNMYIVTGFSENEIRTAPARIDRSIAPGFTNSFEVGAEYPPFIWIGKNPTGEGLIYVINPNKYNEFRPLKLQIGTDGYFFEIGQNARIPQSDQEAKKSSYDGGVIFGGKFTR